MQHRGKTKYRNVKNAMAQHDYSSVKTHPTINMISKCMRKKRYKIEEHTLPSHDGPSSHAQYQQTALVCDKFLSIPALDTINRMSQGNRKQSSKFEQRTKPASMHVYTFSSSNDRICLVLNEFASVHGRLSTKMIVNQMRKCSSIVQPHTCIIVSGYVANPQEL